MLQEKKSYGENVVRIEKLRIVRGLFLAQARHAWKYFFEDENQTRIV